MGLCSAALFKIYAIKESQESVECVSFHAYLAVVKGLTSSHNPKPTSMSPVTVIPMVCYMAHGTQQQLLFSADSFILKCKAFTIAIDQTNVSNCNKTCR